MICSFIFECPYRFVAEKSRRKAIKVGNILWTKKTKRKGHSKINEQIKRNLYTWITRHPQVVQSPISNDCLKVVLDDQIEPQLVPKLLLQVYVRELHNRILSDPNHGGLKDARDEYGKIIISDSTLRSLLPPQLKQMSARYKVMCGCECCIYDKSIHSLLLSWRDRYLKKLKDKSQNAQSRRSGEKAHHIYTTYKNTVMPHGRHIYAKVSDMASAKICAYPNSDNELPHWKCVLRCCAYCPCIDIPYQETNKKHEETTPSIRFHIYHIIGRCTSHDIIPFKYNTIF